MATSNESKRHHYIPQFILRNFVDDNGQLNYWNIEKGKLEKRNTKSVFMNIDMYRDEINHEDEPTAIESELSKMEKEVSDLINTKMLNVNPVVITRAELELLRIYITLQAFRDDYRKKQYTANKFTPSTRKILSKYAVDDDFEDLWKREVEAIAQCRCFDDIANSKTIDPIIKLDIQNNLEGNYMSVVDIRGGELIMSDVYPTLEIFPTMAGTNIHLHALFVISPSRMILLNHIMFKDSIFKEDHLLGPMYERSKIKGDMIIPPKTKYKLGPSIHLMDDQYIYQVRKIYQDDVEYLNTLILNEARIGVIMRNPSKVISSVRVFNGRDDTKQSFEELENVLDRLLNNEDI